MQKSILIDTSKCMACRACQAACKQWNQLPADETTFNGNYENPPQLSPNTWMRITFKEVEQDDKVNWFFGNNRCMHCEEAACMIVCPAGAIYRSETGAVSIDYDKCIGCNYCVANCTFHVMSFDRKTNKPVKCTLCVDRTSSGLIPACAKACPTGAIQYGDRTDLINQATNKVAELRAAGKTKAEIYGLREVSGTGTMFILEDDPEHYGLPVDPHVPLKARIWGVVFKPLRVLAVIAMAFGLWSNRSESKKIQSAMAARDKES